jgi:hypothetical protein
MEKKSINEILPKEIIYYIISIYLPTKIKLLDVRYNNCKLVCKYWHYIYHHYFKIRGSKYALIEKYDRYSFAPPVSHQFQIEYKKNDIYIQIDLYKYKLYVKANSYYCHRKFKIIPASQLEDFGKSYCKRCGKFTYCIDYEFCLGHDLNYCGVLDCILTMSFTYKNITYTFHKHHLCVDCRVYFVNYSYSSFIDE